MPTKIILSTKIFFCKSIAIDSRYLENNVLYKIKCKIWYYSYRKKIHKR